MSAPCPTLYRTAWQQLRAAPHTLWIPGCQLLTFCVLIAACFPFLYHLLWLADHNRLTLAHTFTAYGLVFVYFYLLQYHAALFDLWALHSRLPDRPRLTVFRACLMAFKSSLFVSTVGIAARYSKACAASHYVQTRLAGIPAALHAQLLHLVWLENPLVPLNTALRLTSAQFTVRPGDYITALDVGQSRLTRWGPLALILTLVITAHLIPSPMLSIALNGLAAMLFVTTRVLQLACSQSIRIALYHFCRDELPPPPFTTRLIEAHIHLHSEYIHHITHD